MSLVAALFIGTQFNMQKIASNLNIQLSPGSAATYFTCCGYCYNCFVENLTDFPAVKEF